MTFSYLPPQPRRRGLSLILLYAGLVLQAAAIATGLTAFVAFVVIFLAAFL